VQKNSPLPPEIINGIYRNKPTGIPGCTEKNKRVEEHSPCLSEKTLFIISYVFEKIIFCIPGVKRNTEQETRPRATLSEAKLELKRIVFCGSIPFYKCTPMYYFFQKSCA
jgi:hypothetical protein